LNTILGHRKRFTKKGRGFNRFAPEFSNPLPNSWTTAASDLEAA